MKSIGFVGVCAPGPPKPVFHPKNAEIGGTHPFHPIGVKSTLLASKPTFSWETRSRARATPQNLTKPVVFQPFQ